MLSPPNIFVCYLWVVVYGGHYLCPGAHSKLVLDLPAHLLRPLFASFVHEPGPGPLSQRRIRGSFSSRRWSWQDLPFTMDPEELKAILTTVTDSVTEGFKGALAAQNIQNASMWAQHKTDTEQLINSFAASFPQNSASTTGASNTSTVSPKERTPPTLDSVDPIKWKTFIENFETVVSLNDWADDRAIKVLTTCLVDDAARATAHLHLKGEPTLRDAKAKIETIFLNPAATEYHEVVFNTSKR